MLRDQDVCALQKEAAKKEREEKKALLARRAAEREKALAEAKRR